MNFQRLLNFVGRNAGDVAKSVVPGSLIAGGFGLLESPAAGLTYGLADLAAAFPATMAARGLTRNVKQPWVRGTAENVANIGASLGSTVAASQLLYGGATPLPTQTQQIAQELEQRADVNNLMTQQVAPGTQFQTAGLEFLQNYRRQMPQLPNYYSGEDLALLAAHGAA